MANLVGLGYPVFILGVSFLSLLGELFHAAAIQRVFAALFLSFMNKQLLKPELDTAFSLFKR